MKIALIAAGAAALALTASLSHAAVISSAYTPLGTNTWLADFTITNDGSPSSFAGFTIDFTDATNLVLVASPATWDSIVLQPDASIPDAGFIDSIVMNPANALAVGSSIGGFKVSFTLAAGATPGALPFVINSATFQPLQFGTTTVVPEPGTALTLALGLALFGWRSLRASNAQRNTNEAHA